ncbi:MAG: hypothetical protein QG622_1674 [Actinomycetota bacterium]|nr:hypothetical protein [Actinomycetota bacterium]
MTPRAFSAAESELIRDRLKDVAREAFGRRGLKATTVEELARGAGISKGAFYRFYESKEILLLELADETELALQAEIEETVRADPGRGLEIMLDGAVNIGERSPLIPVLMSPEGLHVLLSRTVEEQQAFLDRDAQLVERVMGLLREAGSTVEIPEKALLGLLRSLVFVGQHRAEIGEDLVDAATAWMVGQLQASLRRTEGE